MSDVLTIPEQKVFPEYPEVPGMVEREIQGLTDGQLGTTHPEKSWGAWSIRQQVSHITYAHYRWFLDICDTTLFDDNPPRDKTLIDTGGANRLMDPKQFHKHRICLLPSKMPPTRYEPKEVNDDAWAS